MTLMFLINQL